MTEKYPYDTSIHHTNELAPGWKSYIEGGSLDSARQAMDQLRHELEEDLRDVDEHWPGLLDGDDAQLEHLVKASRVSGALQALGMLSSKLELGLQLAKVNENDVQQRLFDPEDL